MVTAATIVHVLTCFILVLIVLLQTGKGADMGAVFGGGSSSTIFGSSGAGNLLTRITTGAAVVFMVTSLFLAYSGAHRSAGTMLDRTAAEQEEEPDLSPQAAVDEATGAEGAAGVAAEEEGAAKPPANAPAKAHEEGKAPAGKAPESGEGQKP